MHNMTCLLESPVQRPDQAKITACSSLYLDGALYSHATEDHPLVNLWEE